jgi:hypothetical protein
MWRWLETSEAWRLLHNPSYVSHLDTDEYIDLCKAAGMNKNEAGEAGRLRGLERLRKDLPM